MKTINLSQFDVTSDTSLKPSFGISIPGKIPLGEFTTNILKLNEVNVVMDTISAQALTELRIKYQDTRIAIDSSN